MSRQNTKKSKNRRSEPARQITCTRRKPIELLAPAGSIECMEAAIRAGADAVYMGGPKFGARAYAENPEGDGLVQAIDFVHLHGKKLYLTVNTLLKPEELDSLYDYLLPFYQAGLDGVIVQDMGVVRRIRQLFPELPVHVSTQMTVMDPDGAKALQQLGLTRVVTAREITIPEMKAIAETGVEVEVFVHGAICYCYSGQCLMSSLIGGRSGNRGRCAQPCRLPYDVLRDGAKLTKPDQNYVLNLKDMDTLSCLPEILEAGVDSLKIEGRMKSPRYTFGVTAVYRKYIDQYLRGGFYQVDPEDRRFLQELFDRGGYTEYASRGLQDHMIATGRKPDFRAADETFLRAKEASFPVNTLKEKIKGKLRFYIHEPAIMTMEKTIFVERLVWRDGKMVSESMPVAVCVTESGNVIQPAQNRPMDEAALRQRFDKLGDTPFVWEELVIDTDGQGFLPVGQLNELRRRAAEALEQRILEQYRRNVPEQFSAEASMKLLPETEEASHVLSRHERGINSPHSKRETGRIPSIRIAVDTLPQLRAVLEYPDVERIYLNLSALTQAEEEQALRLVAEHRRNIAPSEKETRSQSATETNSCTSIPSLYLNLPPVLRAHMKDRLDKRLDLYAQSGVEGFLVHTWDQAAWLRTRMPQMRLQADASLYTYNQQAAQTMADLGVDGTTLPVELNARELAARVQGEPLPSELIVYGYLPVMVSAQCVHRTTEGCDGKPGVLQLRDRKSKKFSVRNCCRYCFNVIYNSEPLSLLDCGREWSSW
ncbi:MAG: U32 family peptidase, partial [Lachnospiraceae bacterium]|nr:U32 family peptidase [Lachnospiraceae bacterium]